MAKANFKIEGFKELEKAIKKLGEVPQRAVTNASKKGMKIALDRSKNKAPYLSGDLESGIIMIAEKSKLKGKKVYRIVFDNKMNDVFQKKVINPGPGKRDTAYYPISQEYGFHTPDGDYIGGFNFIEKGLNENIGAINDTILDHMGKEIEKALK